MNSHYLFPYRFKKLGWIIFIPVALFGLTYLIFDIPLEIKTKVLAIFSYSISLLSDSSDGFFKIIMNDITDEIISVLLIISLLFIDFSKEKQEDEFIAQLRLKALVWATYVNYGILLFAILFVYSIPFFWVLVFNIFTILIFFLISFKWMLYKTKTKNQ
jgi:L-asparagine transporter-like permease